VVWFPLPESQTGNWLHCPSIRLTYWLPLPESQTGILASLPDYQNDIAASNAKSCIWSDCGHLGLVVLVLVEEGCVVEGEVDVAGVEPPRGPRAHGHGDCVVDGQGATVVVVVVVVVVLPVIVLVVPPARLHRRRLAAVPVNPLLVHP